MLRRSLFICSFVSLISVSHATAASDARVPEIHWQPLPDLPDALGVAGPFVGVHNGALIVAGGANFPAGVPWRPTPSGAPSLKRYHDSIHVLGTDPASNAHEPQFRWIEVEAKLPHPIGYGVSISTPQGVLCLGGEWQEPPANSSESGPLRLSDDVYLLQWDPAGQRIRISRDWPTEASKPAALPRLPRATTAACGAWLDGCAYVAAGDTGEGGSKQFMRLRLERTAATLGEARRWEPLPSWPGPPRTHGLAVAESGKFFLISGRNKLAPQREIKLLTDAHCFDPAAFSNSYSQADAVSAETGASEPVTSSGWTKSASITPNNGDERCVMAGTAIGFDEGRIAVFGGDPGQIMLRHEVHLATQIAAAQTAGDVKKVEELRRAQDELYDRHPGFSRDILLYNYQSDAWSCLGQLPFASPVTTQAVHWRGGIALPTGEVRPGVRTPGVWFAKIED